MDQLGDQSTKTITCIRCKRPLFPHDDIYKVMVEFWDIVSQSNDKATRRLMCGNTPEEKLRMQGHYHFLPVYDGEKLVCTGSTSRFFYLEGRRPEEAMDNEMSYNKQGDPMFYNTTEENPTREAHKRVQEKFAPRA